MSSCSFTVSLRVSGIEFDPELVSYKLGITPRWKQLAGNKRIAPSGKELPGFYEVNKCSYQLCERREGSLSDFISEQIIKLESCSLSFRELAKSGGKAEFFIGLYISGNSGEVLKFDVLERLGALGVDLSLDVYS